MRVARLEIVRFRGFEHLDLVPAGHVAVIGEPRAGRSDLVVALRRVLEPRALRQRPSEWDIFRPRPEPDEATGANGAGTGTSISVSLLELAPEAEQALEDRLELLHPRTGRPAGDQELDDAELGIRLSYRLHHDPDEQQLEHWIEYTKSGARVGRTQREMLRCYVLDREPPLQLRAEGLLRRLASDPDPDALAEALSTFSDEIALATQHLAESEEIQQALDLVARQGAGRLLQLDGDDPATAIGFAAQDGSLAALLRAVQPTLELDEAGPLPLTSHGSTTSAIFAAAEAAAAARAEGAIVLTDDFGDQLDAASAEYMAAGLRRRAGQLWLTTRQPEVQRAFDPSELVRLTRRTGHRVAFQLSPRPNRAERVRRRHLSSLLAPAISARTVVLVEGPHDFETYTALSAHEARRLPPLASFDMRVVPASAYGGEGGKQQLPKLAQLAADLGMAVRVVLDHDVPGSDKALITELEALSEMVVLLPERVAVERALVLGVDPGRLRRLLEDMNAHFQLGLDAAEVGDSDLTDKCVWALKRKGGLHRFFVEGLRREETPPIAGRVMQALRSKPQAASLVEIAGL